MIKKEYLRAVREAKRVYGYVQVCDGRRNVIRISKQKARDLVQQLADDRTINASWACDDHQYLLVGGYN